MSKLRLTIAVSLDGFVAGPNQSVENPLGVGGMRLHQWAFPLAVWRAMHGLEGGEVNDSSRVMGIEAALEQARRAARGKDVWLAGGAHAARQYLVAGFVDEMEIHLVPTLLGSGERLFQGIDDLRGLELVRTVATPKVTHLKFARR